MTQREILLMTKSDKILAQANKHCPGKSVKLCCRPITNELARNELDNLEGSEN